MMEPRARREPYSPSSESSGRQKLPLARFQTAQLQEDQGVILKPGEGAGQPAGTSRVCIRFEDFVILRQTAGPQITLQNS